MTKKILIDFIATETSLSKKDVAAVLDALPKAIETSIKAGERIVLPNVASFEMKHKDARMGRNPQTGKALEIKARHVVKVAVVGGLKKNIGNTPA
jgi:DNA-binding protein HU-beta